MCLIFQQSEPSVLINRVLTEKKMCIQFLLRMFLGLLPYDNYQSMFQMDWLLSTMDKDTSLYTQVTNSQLAQKFAK